MITVAALSVALWLANTKLRIAQHRLDELTNQSWVIPIDDPSLVHVRPLSQPAPMVFRYRLALPDSKRFKLILAEGVSDSLEILNSSEVSGTTLKSSELRQWTFSVYFQKTKNGWYAGYNDAGGSGRRYVGHDRLDWMEGIEKVSGSWNLPPSMQHKVNTYSASDKIVLLTVNETDERLTLSLSSPAPTIENPRKLSIWLEPIEDP